MDTGIRQMMCKHFRENARSTTVVKQFQCMTSLFLLLCEEWREITHLVFIEVCMIRATKQCILLRHRPIDDVFVILCHTIEISHIAILSN